MKVAVAGASGFIGRHLVAALHSRGDEVIPFSLRAGAVLSPAVFDAVDAVVNLAGEPVAQRWTAEVKRRLRDSRVQGTYNVIAAMTRATPAPKVLVNGSAIGYYGSRGDEVLTEVSTPGNDFLAGVTVAWERAAMHAASLGVRVALIRTGIVLGPGGGAMAKMLPPFRAGVGGKIASGRQWMSWIHIADIVGLFLHALDRDDVRGAVNGTAPEPVRNADFTRALGATLHRPALFTVPRFALEAAYGEMADALVGSQRVLPERALRTEYGFRYHQLR
ncbi:MAG TPA: TIGR01777 family oxidoreductase, partial [Bryobacteraceae bacterium]|nr:TIGR01777 family oxidoreductase [Bryobacteraceae bacterium]